MTDAQRKLRKDHGTPEEFAEAVWLAEGDGFITAAEASKGITRYTREWLDAGSVGVHTFP